MHGRHGHTPPATRVLIVAPADEVVSLDVVKKHLHVEHDDEDDLIIAYRDAFVGQLDAQRGWLGRALRPQTWEYRLNGFPHQVGGLPHHGYPHRRAIELPYPPFIELVSVKYDDANDVERTLVVDVDFTAAGVGGEQSVRLVPAFGKFWPSARCKPESVRIRYKCGYAVDGQTDPLPAQVKLWVLTNLATAYENRESVLTGGRLQAVRATALPTISDNLVLSLKTSWA